MLGVLESVKAAGDIFAPVGGTVLEVNADLSDKPELVNTDCYEKGTNKPGNRGFWANFLHCGTCLVCLQDILDIAEC